MTMKPFGRLALVSVALLLAPLFALASRQNPPPPPRDVPVTRAAGTAVIAGVVVTDEATPAPVRRARVTVRSEEYGNGWSATTDDGGRFEVRAVPGGRYTVQATKPAWLAATYGATRPGRPGTPIPVAEGQRVQGITLRMSRGAVLTGTVVDQAGQPLPGVNVAAMRYGFSEVSGDRVLRATGTDAMTDDQGAYRCYGLPPGDYVVMASLRSGSPTALLDLRRITEDDISRALSDAKSGAALAAPQSTTNAAPTPLVGYAPVFFPGTADVARAMTVKLGAAEERAGLNLTLDVVPTARVEAVPSFPDNANRQSLQVYLVAQQPVAGAASGMATGRRDADGRVIFAGVTPGAYTVIARAALAADPAAQAPSAPAAGRGRAATPPPTLYASVDISVDGRDLVVPLEIAPGLSVSGRVTFDDAANAPKDAAVRVSVVPIKSGPALSVSPAPTDASGAFHLVGVPAAKYRIDYSASRSLDAWQLVSATVGGREVLDAPLEIRSGENTSDLVLRFTSRPSELAGRLQSSGGQPAPAFSIIVFSVDRAFWTPSSRRVRQLRPATDGVFSVRGLPAGEYYIAALTDVEPGEWFDPAFLAQLVGGAAKVVIRDGERTTQDLMIK